MINLLPEAALGELRSLYRRRLFSFALLCLAALVVVSIVILSPSYLAARSHLGQVEESLAAARARPVSKQAESLAGTVKTLNQRIKIVSAEENELKLQTIVAHILAHKKPGTNFSYIDISDEVVVLRGRASSRAAFLSLSAELKEDELFSEVNSPISSLIATSSLDFSIQMKVEPKKDK